MVIDSVVVILLVVFIVVEWVSVKSRYQQQDINIPNKNSNNFKEK